MQQRITTDYLQGKQFFIMGKKNILFTCCLVGAISFSSCEKNLYDESKQPEKEITMTNLDIPADFKWDLTQVSKGTTKANVETMVSLYLDEKCSDSEKVATVPVYTDAINLPLSLPTYVNKIYAKYQNTQGKEVIKSVTINPDGSYSLDIKDAAETTQVASSRAVTRGHDIEDDIRFQGGVVYHPKNGWGTIMFEDQFPILGDYDFNDFVVNYKVQFEVGEPRNKEYTSKTIMIGLRLKAIGGKYPYIPYLRLKEIKKDNVKSIEMYDYKSENEITVKRIENKKNHLIIDCSSLIENLNKRGNEYYNTEKDALVPTEELPEIIIIIELDKREDVDDILEDDEFDLYLKHENTDMEIHMNGIEPVNYKYPYNNANLLPVYESDGDEEDDNYYYSKDKLIWGLRVPGNAAHAIERANFLEAYKNFAKWAQSGGKNNQNWYNQGNANQDLLIHN